MADCFICDQVLNCKATIADKNIFQTAAIQLLCDINDNTNTGGGSGAAALVAPVGIESGWFTMVDAGAVNVQDAALINNPATQISLVTHHLLSTEGTQLILRLRYDAGLTAIVYPVVKVFGYSLTDDYQLLLTRCGLESITLTSGMPALDTLNAAGTFKYTTPDFSVTAWDRLGNRNLLVGIETALSGTGTVSNATIQGKII